MNPLFAQGKPLAEPLKKIVTALGRRRAPQIVLAVADDEALRQEAVAAAGELLSCKFGLFEFDFPKASQLSLPRYCRGLRREKPSCVLAHGLEILAQRDEEPYRSALRFLNAHREDIRDSGCAVILWLDSRTLADVLEQAPDFSDWQSARVTFSLPEGQAVERTPLGRLSIREAEELRSEVRRFREMLQRPNLKRALREEFKKQIDVAESRLGRIRDERRDYRLYLMDELRQHQLRGFAPQIGGRVLSLPLAKVFLPLRAVEGRPALAQYAEEDLDWQNRAEEAGELFWHSRREELEKRRAQLLARQAGQRTLSLRQLLAERRAVLLGDPGSGKTTMTRYIAY
ncbi:MAG: hypothetical protein V3T83_14755, partial [Acidobacteriota bacterium]